jgi:hypothetical protein
VAEATAGVYLRRSSDGPVPSGWAVHQAGTLGGVALDFVFQPNRHDVCRSLGAVNARVAAGLGSAGYQRTAVLDGGWELWVRDRPAALRARLAGFRVIEGGRVRGR